jgi:hypothetical protein
MSYQFHCSRSAYTLHLFSMVAAMGGFLLFLSLVFLVCWYGTIVLIFFFLCMSMEGNWKWHVRFKFQSFCRNITTKVNRQILIRLIKYLFDLSDQNRKTKCFVLIFIYSIINHYISVVVCCYLISISFLKLIFFFLICHFKTYMYN